MSQRFALFLLAVGTAAPAFAGPNYRYVHRPDADLYFGHISWCQLQNDADDPRVLRAEGPQRATVNLPLVPGDTLATSAGRRCEAQFDTGTLMRVDEKTALLIETILAPSLTSKDKLTNLHLRSGRVIVLYRDYDTREVFQILTANAAVKLSRAAVVDIQTHEDGRTVIELQRGQGSLMYGASAETTQTRKLKSGERVTVAPDHTLAAVLAAGKAEDAFQAWNRQMNERFAELHDGKSELPKPIERFPRAVIHFAQRYGDPYGEWIWSELYGYVWRPYRSQDEGWRPYLLGRWVPIGGRQFWVPDEPWGWVPYHLGLWHWDKKHGWVWLPGSAFAPAWVSWGVCDETRYYRPLTLWDWSYRYAYGYRYQPFGYGFNGYGIGNDCGFFPYWQGNQQVTVARLQEAVPAPAPTPLPVDGDKGSPVPRKVPELPLLPLPKELETLARKAEVLQQRTEPALRELVERGGGNLPVPPNGKDQRLADVAPPDPPEGVRFRDWNRDVKAAREMGGHIVYSSVTNLVRCESCSRPLINFDLFARTGGSGNTSIGGGSSNGNSGGNGSTAGGSSGGASMSGVAAGGASGGGGAPMAGLVSGDRKQD
jgi:hypothetical protein